MKTKPAGGSAAVYTAAEWTALARRRLVEAGGQNEQKSLQEAGLEAQVLLSHVLQKPRAWVIAHPEAALDLEQQERLSGLLNRLAGGEPLPYLLGHWEFYGLDLEIDQNVLIPRPETEELVGRAAGWLKDHPARRTAADVGTGSGAIAVSLATLFPDLRLLAVDASRPALEVARRNALRHGVNEQIVWAQSDLLTAAGGPFDLVCANLPYIPTHSLMDLPVSRFEPRQALDGGADGLGLVRALIEDAPRWLAPGGVLLLEMQFDQGEAICRFARHHLPGAQAVVYPDLAGLPRLVEVVNGHAIPVR